MKFDRAIQSLALLLLLAPQIMHATDDYQLGPDSQPQAGVPQGELTRHQWASKIFPGTLRDYWVYVPKQYDPAKPACAMVFQDGANYIKTNGQFRVPVVFDNLIARKEIPVIIGIFINSGESRPPKPERNRRRNAASNMTP